MLSPVFHLSIFPPPSIAAPTLFLTLVFSPWETEYLGAKQTKNNNNWPNASKGNYGNPMVGYRMGLSIRTPSVGRNVFLAQIGEAFKIGAQVV